MTYLVDSDYLIDATANIPRAVATLERLSEQGLAVSIVSYGEIFEGAFGSPDPAQLLQSYRQFLADYPLLPLTDPIMERFARIRAPLRRTGQLVLDLLIAATAIVSGLQLVTRNLRHFERIPALSIYQLINPANTVFGWEGRRHGKRTDHHHDCSPKRAGALLG